MRTILMGNASSTPVTEDVTRSTMLGKPLVTLKPTPENARLMAHPDLVHGVRERPGVPWVIQQVLDAAHWLDGKGYTFMASLSGFDSKHLEEYRTHNTKLYSGDEAVCTPQLLRPAAGRIAAALRRSDGGPDAVLELLRLILPRFKPGIVLDRAYAVDCITLQVMALPSWRWSSPPHVWWNSQARARVVAAAGDCGAVLHHSIAVAMLGNVALPRLVNDPATAAAIGAGTLDPLKLFDGTVDYVPRVATVPTTLGGVLPAHDPLPAGGLVMYKADDAKTRDTRFLACAGQRFLLDVVVAVAAELQPNAPSVTMVSGCWRKLSGRACDQLGMPHFWPQPPRVSHVKDGSRPLDHPELPAADIGAIYDSFLDCA